MAVYSYQAEDARHTSVSGVVAADSPSAARELLRRRGYLVDRIAEQRPRRTPLVFRWRARAGRDASRLLSFLRELATLLAVGVPLVDAIDVISRQHRRSFRSALLQLREHVVAGGTLADGMAAQPRLFDELCVTITEVGEDSGTLEQAIERVAQFRERSEQLRGKMITAMLYPAIVLVMALTICIFLMTSVVPSILEPIVELGRPLPLPTRIVKTASEFLISWGWLAAVSLFLLSIVTSWLSRTPRGQWFWHTTILRVPLFGDLIRKQAIVRIAIVMSVLLRSGVVFVRALQLAQRVTTNHVLKDALERCENAIGAGEEIGEALEHTRAFPPLVTQIFSVGQHSGRLEEMLDRLALDYDQYVATTSQRLATSLEPLLIILLALVVLLIGMATMLPILEASDVLA